jgi:hypothetical protein
VTNEIWRSDNENASNVRIVSSNGLESIALAAITAAITTFAGTATGIATINLRLRVNAQPVINLRNLLKLKHNQQSDERQVTRTK